MTILEEEIKWKFIELVASVSLRDATNIGYRNELSEWLLMYENKIFLLSKLVNQLLMNSTESKIGLLGLEDAHTVLERGVKRGAVKMDVQLEIRWVEHCARLSM